MSTRSPSLARSPGAERPAPEPGRRRLGAGRWAPVVACLLLGLTLAAGCKERRSSPEASLRTFLAQLYARQAKQAWQGLSKSSREALKRDAEALARAAGDPEVKTSPEDLLFNQTELTLLAKPGSISVVSPLGGDEVLLRVTVEEGASANIRMVREGKEWKVDLVGSLEPLGFEVPAATKTSTRAGIEGTELEE